MKIFSFLSCLLIGMFSLISSQTIKAQDSILMPQFGIQEVIITNDTVLYDFKGTESLSGSTKDNSVACMVFKPADPNKVIMITFEEFEVLSDGEGYPAYVKIYSGICDTAGYKWPSKTSDVSGKSKLPLGGIDSISGELSSSKSYVSLDAEGKLTISFLYYYAKSCKGFRAVVRSIEKKDMVVTSATSSYENVNQFLKFENLTYTNTASLLINTDGFENAESLKSVRFVVNKNNSLINSDSLRLYVGSKPMFTTDDNNASILGHVKSYQGDTLELTLTSPYALSMGENMFSLAAYVNNVAYPEQYNMLPFDSTLQISITGFTTTQHTNYTPFIQATPLFTPIVPHIFYLTHGCKGEFKVNGSFAFYDEGGPDEDTETRNFNGQVTFVPANAGEVVKIEFSQFATSNSVGGLSMYHGGDTLIEHLSGSYKYKDMPPKTVSASKDGKLTVQYIMSYNNDHGWVAEVSSIIPQPFEVTSITSTPIDPLPLFAHSQNNKALLIPVQIQGDTVSCEITELTFSAKNSTQLNSLKNIRIYYSGTEKYCDPATSDALLFGSMDSIESNTSSVTIIGNASMKFEKPHYFHLVYDLGEASANDMVKFNLTGAKSHETNLSLLIQGTNYSNTVQSGVSGDFIVGSSNAAHFSNLQKAIDSIKSGIDGPIGIMLENGVYDGIISIPNIPGASSINTITIGSLSQKVSDVTITSNNYEEYSNQGAFVRNPHKGVFNIMGADYLNIQNISFTTENLEFPSVFYVYNQSRFIQVENCYFMAPIPTGSAYSDENTDLLYVTSVDIKDLEGNTTPNENADFFQVQNCHFEGGDIGANISGCGTIFLPKIKDVNVINNIFENQASQGLYIQTVENPSIIGNTVIKEKILSNRDYKGMTFYDFFGKVDVNSNKIMIDTVSEDKESFGFWIRALRGSAEEKALVYNNLIRIKQVHDESYGLYLTNGSSFGSNEYVEYAHNTVRIESSTTSMSCIALYIDEDAKPKNVKFTNNLLQNMAAGCVYKMMETDLPHVQFTCNGVFASDTTSFAYVGKKLKNFDEWKAKAQDILGVAEKAEFLSLNFSGLKTGGSFVSGIPVAGITTDILGMPRPDTNLTLGAYEFEENMDQAPIMMETYPKLANVESYHAEIMLKSSQSSRIYGMVVSDTNRILTPAELLSLTPIEVGKDEENIFLFEDLQDITHYKAHFIIKNYMDSISEQIYTINFLTQYRSTEISTFEALALGSTGSFNDGTAHFTGFTIKAYDAVAQGEADSLGLHIAQINANDSATITIENTSTGLLLDGFLFSSKSDFNVTPIHETGRGEAFTVEAGKGWAYCNLRKKGNIKQLILHSNSTVSIDNFSGSPLSLQVSAGKDSLIQAGIPFVLSANVKGGVPAYQYAWSIEDEILSTEATVSVNINSIKKVSLTVTDAWNNVAFHSVILTPNGDLQIATFEELALESESWWIGDEEGLQTFYNGSFGFDVDYYPSYNSWSGFAYSNVSSGEYENAAGLNNQYRSAFGGGALGSNAFAVSYTFGASSATILNDEDGSSITGCYVTNNAWLYHAATTGEITADDTEPFKLGDYFKLNISGITANGDTNHIEYYLADYRMQDTNEHYILNTWEWVDLSSLGIVSDLQFSVNGSRSNNWGETLPAYFCLDNLGMSYVLDSNIDVEVKEDKAKTLVATSLFTLEGNGKIILSLLQTGDSSIAKVKIESDRVLLSGIKKGNTEIVLKAYQNGKSQFVKLKIDVKEGAGLDSTTYTITFNANGGIGEMPSQEFTAETIKNINKNIFTRVDYMFKGWATTATGEVAYTDEASYIATADTTFYAVWENDEVSNENMIENISQGKLILYPVPTKDNLNIRTDLDNYHLEIYSMMGIKVYERRAMSKGTTIIDVQKLTLGNYILRISTSSQVISRRFVKLD